MDLRRLRPGELIAAAGGVALLVVMFLDWYEFNGMGVTAWAAFTITDVRPAPPAEGPREPAPPPEAEPRA